MIDPSRMARGFSADGIDVTLLDDPSCTWTAGAIVADGADLADWLATLYDTDTGLDVNQRGLLTSRTSDMGGGLRYGLGVMLVDTSNTVGTTGPGIWKTGTGLGHFGGIDGFVTEAVYFPDRKTAIVVILNQDAGNPDLVFSAALNQLFQ